jgi:type IV secretion system protein VirB4
MPRPRLAFFDKDQGAEIFIRALGGRYEVLKPGVPSGFNPLQLEGTPEDRKFLSDLLAFLVRPTNGGQLSADQKKIIDSAVEQIFEIPLEERRFAEVAQLLSGREVMSHDDMASRFDVWLKGSRGWLFNNERDAWDGSNGILGFDMTKVLDDPEIRTAALGYIFHRIESLMTGDPLALVIDEGWKLAQDPIAAGFVIDKLKTIRKLNGIVGFVTQSAKDIVKSGMAHTLLEQTPTNVFFPNPKADDESYLDGFKLSKRELHWVRSTVPEAREFLIKHDQDSVIAKLDLSHMRPFIKVLSGNVATVAECEDLRKRYGDAPEKWLPHFCGLEVGHADDD